MHFLLIPMLQAISRDLLRVNYKPSFLQSKSIFLQIFIRIGPRIQLKLITTFHDKRFLTSNESCLMHFLFTLMLRAISIEIC
jgi:hypothetical protein